MKSANRTSKSTKKITRVHENRRLCDGKGGDEKEESNERRKQTLAQTKPRLKKNQRNKNKNKERAPHTKRADNNIN